MRRPGRGSARRPRRAFRGDVLLRDRLRQRDRRASDIAAAKLWYGKAAERGTTKARDALVRLELNGVGTGARCD